jgi:uncharacterized membrane protein
MNATMLILRIIHIFTGVFWAGFAFFNIIFLQPTIRAIGTEGQKTMQHLTQKTRFLTTLYIAVTLTVLSGLIMYWILAGSRLALLQGGHGHSITMGSVAGLVVWILLMFIIHPIFSRMKAIGKKVEAQGAPPTAEQIAEMQALGKKLGKVGRWAASLLAVSLLGMAVARYAAF